MRYAIDRLNVGYEEEVSAESFYGDYIVRKTDRFFCPECGERVFWRSRGGSHPDMFYHPKRTIYSPECEKRVDGQSNLYVYQRVGLPMKIARRGNTFFLYLAFPAINERQIETASRQKSKVIISANGTSKSFPINFTYFQADRQTLLPVNFVSIGENYSIKVENMGNLFHLRQKWSDYSDGFTCAGAIFTNEDDGARKVRRGDSISTNKRYYLITKEYHPYYSEIMVTLVGSVNLNRINYGVYEMEVNVSVYDSFRYSAISNHLKQRFGVWLLETAPELIPLWPPVTAQDVFIPLCESRSLICAVSSGNNTPRVFRYERNRAKSVQIDQDVSGNNTVELPIDSCQETIVSVDRKYVGREAVFCKKPFAFTGGHYDIELQASDGSIITENDITAKDYQKQMHFRTNAKLELYIKSRQYVITHLAVREKHIHFPDCKQPHEIVLTVEQGVIKRIRLKRFKLSESMQTPEISIPEIIYAPDYVPIPRWVGYLLSEWQKNGHFESVQKVSIFFNQGKMPYPLLKELMNYMMG